jgi:hypothetical protein
MTEKTEPKPSHKGLYSALAAAQAEMGRALKDTNNPHFKSKYADLSSVCDACMPALSKHGIAVLQPSFDDETGRYVKTIFVHGDSGETVECRVPLIVAKTDMQGYGSSVTYARRYGLMGMAGIAPEDDDGNAAAKAPPAAEPKRQAPNDDDAVNRAIDYISAAVDIADLQASWANLPGGVKADARVIAAKDKAKHDLKLVAASAPIPAPNADLGQDEIPY